MMQTGDLTHFPDQYVLGSKCLKPMGEGQRSTAGARWMKQKLSACKRGGSKLTPPSLPTKDLTPIKKQQAVCPCRRARNLFSPRSCSDVSRGLLPLFPSLTHSFSLPPPTPLPTGLVLKSPTCCQQLRQNDTSLV